MKKLILLSALIVLLTGCTSLKKKSFGAVVAGQGGKAVIADPTSGSIFPTFVGGSWYSSILTVPVGVKSVTREVKTYSWWGTLLVDEQTTVNVEEKEDEANKFK